MKGSKGKMKCEKKIQVNVRFEKGNEFSLAHPLE